MYYAVIRHADGKKSKSKYSGGFKNGKNTSAYNHDYYMKNKWRWGDNKEDGEEYDPELGGLTSWEKEYFSGKDGKNSNGKAKKPKLWDIITGKAAKENLKRAKEYEQHRKDLANQSNERKAAYENVANIRKHEAYDAHMSGDKEKAESRKANQKKLEGKIEAMSPANKTYNRKAKAAEAYVKELQEKYDKTPMGRIEQAKKKVSAGKDWISAKLGKALSDAGKKVTDAGKKVTEAGKDTKKKKGK